MGNSDLALKAHLMRRAGFGASRSELEELAEKNYEEIVEDLLHPERVADLNEDYLRRFNPEVSYHDSHPAHAGRWIWRMINSKKPLEEKMALLWHQVFPTAYYKAEHTPTLIENIETYRNNGLSNMKQILLDLAKDPSMNYWLDNCENHADQPNENWGRELLELFSMGVGNYSEDDIKNASRAFTGWTFEQPLPLYPFGNYESKFVYDDSDHDDGEKTFLGQAGRFNGEDIIRIICQQPATAKFVSRHLYNFFVEDENQVHTWNIEPPKNPEAIEGMMKVFVESDGDIKSILRFVFNSDFFKEATYKKVKNPAELVAGTIKMTGTYGIVPQPNEGVVNLYSAASVMGQGLMNPPTVEGWHTGQEWIDGGTLNERINFAVNLFNDLETLGMSDILDRLGDSVQSGDLVDSCLDIMGSIEVSDATQKALEKYADAVGDIDLSSHEARTENAVKVARLIQLIVATREYQFA